MTLHVAVAIVAFRNADDIERCLAAMDVSTYADFEIIICENGGAEAHAALIRRLPSTLSGGQNVRVVQAEGNLGFPGGVNRCLSETPDADAWWVLNPDTQPRPDALGDCVRRLEVGDCDAVGCTVYLPDGRIASYGGVWRPWLARAVSLGYGRALADPIDAAAVERDQNYIIGAAMLVGRRFLEATGPMRADYFLYCEEIEWCIRGIKSGMKLAFSPTAMVMHLQGTTTGSGGSIRTRPQLPIYLGERNRVLLTRDLFPQCLFLAAPLSLAHILAKYGKDAAWKQLGYAVSGWWAGLCDRRGRPPFLPG